MAVVRKYLHKDNNNKLRSRVSFDVLGGSSGWENILAHFSFYYDGYYGCLIFGKLLFTFVRNTQLKLMDLFH